MDLICWTANATDQIFSTMRSGRADSICSGGTFAAGYGNNLWGKWGIHYLSQLLLEDFKDIYIIGFMISCFLLIGASGIWMYWNLLEQLTAKDRLRVLCNGTLRAIQTHNEKLNKLENKIDDLFARMYHIEVSLGKMETSMEQVTVRLEKNHKM